jgi:hypothetical protein
VCLPAASASAGFRSKLRNASQMIEAKRFSRLPVGRFIDFKRRPFKLIDDRPQYVTHKVTTSLAVRSLFITGPLIPGGKRLDLIDVVKSPTVRAAVNLTGVSRPRFSKRIMAESETPNCSWVVLRSCSRAVSNVPHTICGVRP